MLLTIILPDVVMPQFQSWMFEVHFSKTEPVAAQVCICKSSVKVTYYKLYVQTNDTL